jgi:TolB-like protein
MTKQGIAQAEIRAALERMAGSEMFRDSPQLAAFLRFVAEAELRGESDRIKGYTLGVEALGRGKDFDPQIDPIVRVEATRLRRTIERYYAGPGAGDPVVITLSPGSYVPSFRLRESASIISVQLGQTSPGRRRKLVAGVAVFAAGLLISAYFLYPRISSYLLTRSLQPGNGMPTILLQPLAVAGTPVQDVLPQGALIEKLRDAISRFDTLNAVLQKEVADAERSGIRQPIRFRLTGLAEYRDDGNTNLLFQLFDAEDGTLVWSRLFERYASTGSRAAAEDAVVTEVVTSLGQPFGVIRAHERNRYIARKQGDPRYICILETSDSLRSFDPAQHRRAKECLETLIRHDPSFASG